MNQKISNYGLRVRSNGDNELDLLLVSVIALIPFLPFILSGAFLAVVWAALLVINRTRRAVFEQKHMFVLNVLISGLSLLSSLISGNVIGMLISFGVFVLLTVGCYLMSVMTASLFNRVTLITSAASIPVAVVAALQQIIEKNPAYRPSAHAFNPNYLGSIAALSAVFAMIRFFERDEKSSNGRTRNTEKALYLLSFLACCVTILATQSRSSLLALMLCVLAYIFLTKHYVLFAVALVGGIGLWVIGWFKPELFSWSNSLIEVFTVRYEIWQDAFKSFSQNAYTALIGRGPMSYYHVRETEGLALHDHAHNIFLDTLINVGVIGAVLYVLLLLVFVRRMLHNRKAHDNTAFLFVAIALIEIFVQGIPDVTIMWHQTAPLFLLGCSAVCTQK